MDSAGNLNFKNANILSAYKEDRNCMEKVKAFGRCGRKCFCCCVKSEQGNGTDQSQISLFRFGLLHLPDSFFSLPEEEKRE